MTTDPGAGTLQRLQTIDIVTHNILWIVDREPNIQENFFIPFRIRRATQSRNETSRRF